MARPSAIEPVSQAGRFISICIYGDNGVGKTPLIAGSRRCLLLDADNGAGSAGAAGSTADRWLINDWNDATEASEYIREEGYREFDWVWLDSASGMQDKGLAHIMDDLVAAKPHRSKFQPDKGEFGQNMNHLKDFVRIMKGLPINFGITAHPFRYMDDSEEEPAEKIWPFIQGRNMPQTIMGYMDVIAYMTRRTTKEGALVPVLFVGGLERVYARDRFGALPERIVRPDLVKMEDAIRSKIKTAPPVARKVGGAKLPAKKVAGQVRKAVPTPQGAK